MIELFSDEQDDLQYLDSVKHIINGASQAYQPAGIYIVRINGWFDHKWLGFSGKVQGQMGVWVSPVTLPPFHPHRVLSQRYYHWDPIDKRYTRATGWARLHKYQGSSQNFYRKLGRIARSAMFVWFTSNTLHTGRGSLMVYMRSHKCRTIWFASFNKVGNNWRIQTKNISSQEIEFFENTGKQMEPLRNEDAMNPPTFTTDYAKAVLA